jgi:Zn-dependent protease
VSGAKKSAPERKWRNVKAFAFRPGLAATLLCMWTGARVSRRPHHPQGGSSVFLGGFKVGRFLGIDVVVDFSWFVAFALFTWGFSQFFIGQDGLNLAAGAGLFLSMLTVVAAFASIIAHEYGHSLMARRFGIGTRRIVLMIFGGVAELESESRSALEEFLVAIAGPAVSLVLGLGFLGLSALAGMVDAPAAMVYILGILGYLNLVWVVFNALPGFPMDGGRVLRAIVWAITGNYLFSTKFAAGGGVLVGGLLILSGIVSLFSDFTLFFFGGSPIHILLGYFLIRLARGSVRQAEMISRFDGLTVRQMLRPIRAVLSEDVRLADAAEGYFAPLRVDQLPVVRGPQLVGYLDRADLGRFERRQWDWVRVEEAMRSYSPDNIIDVHAAATAALRKLASSKRESIAVFDGRKLLGHVTRDDIIAILNAPETPRGQSTGWGPRT